MNTLSQKLTAEFVGTFTLIFIGAGSICTDQFIRAAGGTGPGLLGIAVAHGLAIGIMVTSLGHISGGHFNPAVTIGFWVTRRMQTIETLFYWAAQILGGIAAAYLLRGIIPEETWRAVHLGTPMIANEAMPAMNAIALEAVLTFLLVWVVFATAVDEKVAFGKIAGFAIGLTITMDILVGGPLTGAAMNPARVVGPALASRWWPGHGVYWCGPLLGGAIAAGIYDFIFLRHRDA